MSEEDMLQFQAEPKPIRKMTSDEIEQELLALREQKASRSQRLKQSMSQIEDYANGIIEQNEDSIYMYAQKGIALLPDSQARQTFQIWIKIFYTKYKNSNKKWIARVLIGALVFYLLGQALITLGGEWLAKSRIVQKCKFLINDLGQIIKLTSQSIGSVVTIFWNWFKSRQYQ